MSDVSHYFADSVTGARDRFRAERIGVIFQQFNLLPYASVADNILLPLRFAPERRKRAGDALAEADRLCRALGLPDTVLTTPAGRLSVGQQQRVAVARALIGRPPLIVADEPTSALDPELVGEVLDVLRQLRRDGMTMILATHEMSFARELADKVCFLDAGHILEEGPPDQIFRAPERERTRAFLSRVL